MQTLKPSPVALPPVLIYAAALTCGVLAGMAAQVYLNGAGFDLAGLWESPFASGARQLRTAGPWWAIAGVAFVASGMTAAALSRLPPALAPLSPDALGCRRGHRARACADRTSQRRARGRGRRRQLGGEVGWACGRGGDGVAGCLCRGGGVARRAAPLSHWKADLHNSRLPHRPQLYSLGL